MIPWDILRRQRAAIAKLIDGASDEVLIMWARAWTDLRAQIEAEVERRGQARMLTYSADYAGARLVEVAQRSSAVLADAARRLIELSLSDAAALIGAQLPANWPLSRPAKPELDAIVQRATTQITSRMWVLSDEATEAMRRRLVQGVAMGRVASQIGVGGGGIGDRSSKPFAKSSSCGNAGRRQPPPSSRTRPTALP